MSEVEVEAVEAPKISKKQQEVLDKFNSFELQKVETDQCSFGCNGEVYDLKDGQIYKIKGESTYIMFGEIQRSMSFEKIKELLAQYQKNGKFEMPEEEGEDVEENTVEEVKEEKEEETNNKDIEFLMNETKCTKEEALKALTDCNMDVVEAMICLQKK